MDIQIATPDDVDDLVTLGHAMRAESTIGFPPIDLSAVAAHVRLVAAHPDRAYMAIARTGPNPVGLVGGVVGAYAFSHELRASCDTLFVRPDFRGRHAGIRLQRRFECWAAASGARSVYFGVSTGITPEQTARLLACVGYVPLGQTFRKEIDICALA
jgi:GNAT superfamily N-acetyltransferase